jgi:hypothetical protein
LVSNGSSCWAEGGSNWSSTFTVDWVFVGLPVFVDNSDDISALKEFSVSGVGSNLVGSSSAWSSMSARFQFTINGLDTISVVLSEGSLPLVIGLLLEEGPEIRLST